MYHPARRWPACPRSRFGVAEADPLEPRCGLGRQPSRSKSLRRSFLLCSEPARQHDRPVMGPSEFDRDRECPRLARCRRDVRRDLDRLSRPDHICADDRGGTPATRGDPSYRRRDRAAIHDRVGERHLARCSREIVSGDGDVACRRRCREFKGINPSLGLDPRRQDGPHEAGSRRRGEHQVSQEPPGGRRLPRDAKTASSKVGKGPQFQWPGNPQLGRFGLHRTPWARLDPRLRRGGLPRPRRYPESPWGSTSAGKEDRE